MQFNIETRRLLLREIRPTDDSGMFELDSNPEVHRFLGNNPVKTIEQSREMIEFIRKQYDDFGIGRWAAIEKETGEFMGWSGLKFITNLENGQTHFHDVGYRFIPRYWDKGYATESALAALEYAFEKMNLEKVVGTCHVDNIASRKALEKCGLMFITNYLHNNLPCNWLEIDRNRWADRKGYL